MRPCLAATLALALLAAPAPAAEANGSAAFTLAGWTSRHYRPWRHYYPPVPYYYPPPGYYYPPPGWYPAPVGPPSWSCYAGPYMCQLDEPVPKGAPCFCPVNDKTRVRGYAG